ncbi:MAG: ABC transporter permease [Gemmatimonadales bacterium]|nr:ABC transporter permease [Gemmatimonadota bacterium]MDX2057933.1 ABC transporter permease [Gemmatimonadales bacterium]
MVLPNLGEGFKMAMDSLRANKLRSFLTILGVVIGVATVMTMASIVEGIRGQIFNALNAAVPNTFYVFRFNPSSPVNPDNLPPEIRARPIMDERDAMAIARSPVVRHAALWCRFFSRIEFAGARTQTTEVFGGDERFMDLQGGTLLRGRFFAPSEIRGGAPVTVLASDVAATLFGNADPIGQYVRMGTRALQVIGVWQPPDNVFRPQGVSTGAVIPYQAAKGSFRFSETTDQFIIVLGEIDRPVDEVKDGAAVALRRHRGLRPGVPNDFDMLTQDQILDIIGKLTGAFFLVMVALSGVALLVGGIGVMAIMMVSVTSRTREIGTRKALGATRREILWQFLVEAASLTLLGGLLGIAAGIGFGELVKLGLRIDAAPPLWSAVVAVAVSIGIGLGFGLYPANRAARMDPVEALRHE